MAEKNEKTALTTCEDVRIRNYLTTELTVANFRWLIIGFLALYFNILRPPGWPIALFNGILAAVAAYNFGIIRYTKRAKAFTIKLTLLLLSCDMIAAGAGLFFTGGAASPFLFIWYLTLFTAGIRFGFAKSLLFQIPMALFYSALLFREAGMVDAGFLTRAAIGVFSFAAVSQLGAVFSREEEYTLTLMSDFRKDAITDRLTGLYNYAYFIDELRREEARAERTGSHFSLILFDLDFFKQVNDTYGHEKGNILLQQIAQILKSSARRMDTVARYGGEEFVILMPDSSGAEMEVAERIRRKVEEVGFPGIAEKPIRITISAGACTYPKDAKSADDLMDKADRGLYLAKSGGRNRACYCR